MTGFENNDRYLLAQQACAIRKIGEMVAERYTWLRRQELYAIDQAFVELSFSRYRKKASVEDIKHIQDVDGLKPYLDKIKLSISP
ncbi:MAG: hypothetical protein WBA23_13695 [Tunicatimonas sp.]|uniref:hypothetical protein n=1 Tax=Tunicatimonas sp. TaxID=1940096 RepID=UPI003C728DF9